MKLVIATTLAAAVTAAAIAAGASGQAPAATIALVEHDSHFAFIDIAPKGGTRKPPSEGDQFVIGGRVTQGGKAAGTSNLVCTVTQPGAKGLSECVGTLVLPGGTLTIGGVARLATNSDTFAVTGGTGVYANATGTVASAQTKGGADALTVLLG